MRSFWIDRKPQHTAPGAESAPGGKDHNMRKEKKHENKRRTPAHLQGYHMGNWSGENYAFQGFEKNLYFTSDRTKECDENFNRLDGQPMRGLGLEIETGFILHGSSQARAILSNIMTTAIFPLFPAHLFKQQCDSTITGTEVITQVMTKEFIRNHYKDFKTMWNDLFPMFGITTDDGQCGMHVNISVGCFGTTDKSIEENVRKMYYVINRHYDLFKIAFYRPGSSEWCERMDYSVARTMDIHHMSGSHGNCFNGSHYDAGRVEIRLVGGQKNFACFRNTMETIFHLITKVKTLSWKQCDDVVAIFTGCNQYVYDRISTKCYSAGTITREALDAIQPTIIREELL